jgi:hypothetical protein
MVSPAGSRSHKNEAINMPLERLGFDHDEVDNLNFEEEVDVPKEGVK